ncbi:MAG: class D sortase [Anaerolineaceae bacterium]|nr:class D sortase [Anaerolineaceae bacterium]
MARKRFAEDLTTEELRHLLIEKRRAERHSRLDRFRRTGRVVVVEPEPQPVDLEALQSEAIFEEDDYNARKSGRRRGLDGFLLLIEIAAVLGLIYIVFSGLSLLRNLNREVATVLEQPTLTATPLIVAVILPSGHTPPNSPGGVQPNEAEIPEHLRPLIQSLGDLPVPTPGPQQAIRIQIPAIGVDAPIVHGDGWDQLKKGVGQQYGTPKPGENGNIVLSAHNDVFGEIFRDLDQLKEGDEVIIFNSQRTYTYIVQHSQIVEPTFVEVLAATRDPVVTLISCYPYLVDNKRIVVVASLLQ